MDLLKKLSQYVAKIRNPGPKWAAMGEKNFENIKILLEYSYSKYNSDAYQFLAESDSSDDLGPW